jgi:TetR/AcrR family transcriptional regulator, acrAB operon repressor
LYKKRLFVFFNPVPKLKLAVVDRNQLKIEEAALRVFTRQGYHGTSVREIAEAAGVSLGNLYNYYANKEDLFARLVKRYEEKMAARQRKLLASLVGEADKARLRRLARSVRQIVYGHPDYWRLMYIDVVEFGNRHFAHGFRDLARNLAAVAGQAPRLRKRLRNDIDPVFAFSALYLQLFTYYLVERLFGGRQHLGLPEKRAIAQLIEIYTAAVDGGDGGEK